MPFGTVSGGTTNPSLLADFVLNPGAMWDDHLSMIKNALRPLRDAGFYLLNRTRYWLKRLEGFESANPDWKSWQLCPRAVMANSIEEILSHLPLRRWQIAIDLGCGFGLRARSLRNFSSEVWGVDIVPDDRVKNVTRYIRVAPDDRNCLHAISDGEVDVVFAINLTGFGVASTWRKYFLPQNERLKVYLEPQNFPRVLRKGGYFILAEWEPEPEARWGRASLEEISKRAVEYDPPPLVGFELVVCDFARTTRSPFVVYRRV